MLRVNENMVEGTDSALKTFQTSQDSRLLYLSPGKFVLDVNGCHIKYICTIYNRQKVHSTDNIQTITDMTDSPLFHYLCVLSLGDLLIEV